MSKVTLEKAIGTFVNDPLGYVYFNFPWGESGSPLEGEEGPDKWQIEVLDAIAKGTHINDAIRMARRSGHGIGKSALIAWIIKWFMDTRPHPQIVVTANTKPQLESKTWRELAKWHNMSRTASWCKHTASKFYRIDHPETWFAMAIPWTKDKSEAFAGTHEKHVLLIFDEASAIDDVIWEVAEGAMTGESESGEAITKIWVVFGNPTRNTGRFSECFKKYRHRWNCKEIDSRTAKKADKKQIAQWIEDYGEDSDFVRVRVKGQEPRAGFLQFIGADIVEEAMGRTIHPSMYEFAPKILGVDIAREGDDRTVFTYRQGVVCVKQKKLRIADSMALGDLIKQESDHWEADGVILDMGNIGAAVYDYLTKRLNMDNVLGVWFGGKANDDKYFNKRAEMWGEMRDWLKNGGIIPDDNELRDDLTAPETVHRNDDGRIQLEKKKDMKKRGLPSPDSADSLAITFAFNIEPGSSYSNNEYTYEYEYD